MYSPLRPSFILFQNTSFPDFCLISNLKFGVRMVKKILKVAFTASCGLTRYFRHDCERPDLNFFKKATASITFVDASTDLCLKRESEL